MKIIELEGTPAEIKEYLDKKNEKINENIDLPPDCFYGLDMLKNKKHYSVTVQQWIPICDMPKEYIVNILRQLLDKKTTSSLLKDSEFLSLMYNFSKQS